MTCQRFHKHTVQQCGLHLLGLYSCNNTSQVTTHILNINIMHLKKKAHRVEPQASQHRETSSNCYLQRMLCFYWMGRIKERPSSLTAAKACSLRSPGQGWHANDAINGGSEPLQCYKQSTEAGMQGVRRQQQN